VLILYPIHHLTVLTSSFHSDLTSRPKSKPNWTRSMHFPHGELGQVTRVLLETGDWQTALVRTKPDLPLPKSVKLQFLSGSTIRVDPSDPSGRRAVLRTAVPAESRGGRLKAGPAVPTRQPPAVVYI